MKQVIVLQGISGSGKSTFGRKLATEAKGTTCVVSADHYFEITGTYRFDPKLLGEAHGACFKAFLEALEARVSLIVVDNTNTRIEEVSPYFLGVQMANLGLISEEQYAIKIVQVSCDVSVAARRNVHNVSSSIILRMAGNIATCQFPPWWTVEKVGQA